jgi:DNA-binding response OmpR family regulator
MSNIRLLLVDDEEDFRIPIASILTNNGMEVKQAGSPSQMDKVLTQFTPHIIVLDVNLPEENGFEIARRLKQTADYSIVMLTAYGSVEDRVEGLSRGADYYLPKPVDTRELLAIIHNLYKRHHDADIPSAPWLLNKSAWTLTTPDHKTHELTKPELQILTALAKKQGEPVSRRELYSALGLASYAPETRSVDNQVSRLRRRFTTDNYTLPIKTVHSVGYVFSDPIMILD